MRLSVVGKSFRPHQAKRVKSNLKSEIMLDLLETDDIVEEFVLKRRN